MLSDREEIFQEFSDYTLYDTGKFEINNGMDVCLPPKNIIR